MDPAFDQVEAPRRFRILGLELQPLTIGHRRLLAREKCAFLSGDRASIEDLMLAVFVCSQPWAEAERRMHSHFFGLFIWVWSQFLRRTVLSIEYEKFSKYFNAGHARPEFQCKGESSQSSSPYELRSMALLMAKFHMSKSDALNTTIAEANALILILGEHEGLLEFQADSTIQFRQWHADRMAAKWANERN
jgi:hypothetical protein